jgi:hypothetical protein
MCPVLPEGLVQMAMGTPSAIYNGGLLQAHVRYFDPRERRSGLPAHVAALVDGVSADAVSLTLVNTDPVKGHSVLLQAGSFGEHEFTGARIAGAGTEGAQMADAGSGGQRIDVSGKHLEINLGPAAQARLHLGLRRFAHRPSHRFPTFD